MKIRQKLSFVFVIFVIIFILLGILCNVLFMEKYYLRRLEDQFNTMHQSIENEYKSICKKENIKLKAKEDCIYDNRDYIKLDQNLIEQQEVVSEDSKGRKIIPYIQVATNNVDIAIQNYIRQLELENDVKTLLFDKNLIIHASSFNVRMNYKNVPLKRIRRILSKNSNWTKKEYLCITYENKQSDSSIIAYVARFPNDQILIIYNSVKEIRSSIDICNDFFVYVGIIMIFLGILVGILIAKYMSRPLIQMSKTTTAMANLDFSYKINITSKDEIGRLGEGINELSVKLDKSIKALQNEVEYQKTYIRNLSHELKSPIAVIQGYADGLRYGVADDLEMQKKYSKIIAEECQRMNLMVQQLLNLSALESANIEITKSSFFMNELLSNVLERYKQIIKHKQVDISIVSDQEVVVTGNYVLIECAIGNIIGNAVKYVMQQGAIVIKLKKSDSSINFTVFNTGSHVGEEHIDKIWEVFYKEDKARSRKLGGHGIGLSIVKSIIELHNGTVSVQNIENGVEFGFSLPKHMENNSSVS